VDWMVYIITHSFYCTCFTDNQWSCWSDTETCSHGFRSQMRRAAAFKTLWRMLTVNAGSPATRKLQ